ncbi:23S rRNA (adenine(1618)-N(6))-methyltransferase RlmF [Flavivirga abyssicola]|uniref:23S rRNA (adenine(1618)-N(6))-methyltransferase RlmF n=1 Tax=Flavivirga abyssicola TaxID=3063533 RepID=UPI0026DF57BB|nr:23S rRNA (adenine(1618)-N(6))-methyltransferase RlmF [Flavivirga sp. MEBiC07777]WVK15373.1 23S rRNA (adenine(1618)-N(6))-methyltransferase RlmF [Flavivirga sp. MEBiC07777]
MKTNSNFHTNNKHKSGYDLDVLCASYPDLKLFVFENQYQTKTIDFADPKAVKALNTALLFAYYNIKFWEFPDTNLCPPIPGRVDYLHHLEDLLKQSNIHENIHVLDIGTGASCIYPILGNAEYNWSFVGTDIDEESLKCAQKIISKNKLESSISLRHQLNNSNILKGILKESDRFPAAICNPPFYKSETEALEATTRKLKGLNKNDDIDIVRNFSGTHNELWYKGGEKAFIHNYLYESSLFKEQCLWFTTLVSKKDLVRGMQVSLKKLGAKKIKIINMGQGNKISRIVAWTFK